MAEDNKGDVMQRMHNEDIHDRRILGVVINDIFKNLQREKLLEYFRDDGLMGKKITPITTEDVLAQIAKYTDFMRGDKMAEDNKGNVSGAGYGHDGFSRSADDFFPSGLNVRHIQVERDYQGKAAIGRKSSPLTFDGFPASKEDMRYFRDLKLIVDNVDEVLRYAPLRAFLPKGILIAGATGIGKSTLLDTIIAEFNVPSVKFDITDISSAFQFETTVNLQKKFDMARDYMKTQHKPVVIVGIEDLDSIAAKRDQTGPSEYKNSIINTININMDGAKSVYGFIVIGTTSNPDMLDSALLKRGRFSDIISLDYRSA